VSISRLKAKLSVVLTFGAVTVIKCHRPDKFFEKTEFLCETENHKESS
jgi:hypothetical protein